MLCSWMVHVYGMRGESVCGGGRGTKKDKGDQV